VILHSIAGVLASDADADELLSLADDLTNISRSGGPTRGQ
jgi:hypothetical protein